MLISYSISRLVIENDKSGNQKCWRRIRRTTRDAMTWRSRARAGGRRGGPCEVAAAREVEGLLMGFCMDCGGRRVNWRPACSGTASGRLNRRTAPLGWHPAVCGAVWREPGLHGWVECARRGEEGQGTEAWLQRGIGVRRGKAAA